MHAEKQNGCLKAEALSGLKLWFRGAAVSDMAEGAVGHMLSPPEPVKELLLSHAAHMKPLLVMTASNAS